MNSCSRQTTCAPWNAIKIAGERRMQIEILRASGRCADIRRRRSFYDVDTHYYIQLVSTQWWTAIDWHWDRLVGVPTCCLTLIESLNKVTDNMSPVELGSLIFEPFTVDSNKEYHTFSGHQMTIEVRAGALKMTEMKMTDHRNVQAWNWRTWNWPTFSLMLIGCVLILRYAFQLFYNCRRSIQLTSLLWLVFCRCF